MCIKPALEGGKGRPRVHNCIGWNRSFALCQVPLHSYSKESVTTDAGLFRRLLVPARPARDSRCTVSTRTATLSGGVAGTMPCPRLKMWPGAAPAARTTAVASRATLPHPRAAPADRDCPAAQRGCPRAGGQRRSTVQSSPTHAAPHGQWNRAIVPAFREHDRGNLSSVWSGAHCRQHGSHRIERERMVGVGRQQPAPRVEYHHRIGAGKNLLVEIGGHGTRVHRDKALQQVGPAMRHAAHRREVGTPGPLDHVAREGERAACEADQRNATLERALDLAYRIEHIAERGHVRHLSAAIESSSAVVRSNRGPSPPAK